MKKERALRRTFVLENPRRPIPEDQNEFVLNFPPDLQLVFDFQNFLASDPETDLKKFAQRNFTPRNAENYVNTQFISNISKSYAQPPLPGALRRHSQEQTARTQKEPAGGKRGKAKPERRAEKDGFKSTMEESRNSNSEKRSKNKIGKSSVLEKTIKKNLSQDKVVPTASKSKVKQNIC